jgi:hypothetical protein
LQIDTKGANIDAIQLAGKITGFEKIENLRLGSASSAAVTELKTVNSQISDNSFSTAFTLTDPKVPFSAQGARVFTQLSFSAAVQLEQVSAEIVFDSTVSKVTLYGTGIDTLVPPQSITIVGNLITSEPIAVDDQTEQKQSLAISVSPSICYSDSDCSTDMYCPRPTSIGTCPDGTPCNMPVFYCVPKITSTPAPSALPSPTSIVTVSKNCSVDSDCSANMYCYQPPMPVCPEGRACMQVMPLKECRLRALPSPTSVFIAPTPIGTIKPETYPVPTTRPSATPTSTPAPTECKRNTSGEIYCPSAQESWKVCPSGSYNVTPAGKDNCGCPLPQTCVKQSVTQQKCTYQLTEFGACLNGVQSRQIITNPQCTAYEGPAPVLVRPCQISSCTQNSECGAKSECVDGGQGSRICDIRTTAADVNSDNKLNILDVSILIGSFFKNNPASDLNSDGAIDIVDYSLMIRVLNRASGTNTR